MDVQRGFNAQGSFGVPQHLVPRQPSVDTKPATPPTDSDPDRLLSKPAPAVASSAAPSAQPEATPTDPESPKDEIESLRRFWEDRLKISITERDIRDYIFKGRLVKDNVEVIPGYMLATFQSLNPEELSAVDQKMALFRESVKFTTDGLNNENALQVLAYGWLKSAEVDESGVKPMKSMGNTPEERYKTVTKISALAVQEAIEAWDGFNVLLKIALRERRLLKKS